MALDIVDRDSLDGLTMRALGRELGADPMAAYYHLPNKTAVLDGIVEAVWSELDLPEPSSQPWQERLEAIARAIRDTLRRHPNALPILATRPPTSPHLGSGSPTAPWAPSSELVCPQARHLSS